MNANPQIVSGGYGKTPPRSTIKDCNEIFMCIDWFTCTFDFIQMNYRDAPIGSWQHREYKEGTEKLEKLYQILTYPDRSERHYEKINISGYSDGYITLGEYIKIWFTGSLNSNGLYHNKLDMSGQACKDFIDRGGSFKDLFEFMISNGANFTRVDCAFDVLTDKYFDIYKLYQYVHNYSYVSPMRHWSYVKSGNRTTETYSGETLYIGSTSSDTLICIYDKKLEMFEKGVEVYDPVWIRIEVRFKRDRAKWFVGEYMQHADKDSDYSFIAEALFAVLDFKEKNENDSNRSRWKTTDWWIEFLSNASKADFASKIKIKPTIERKLDWLDRSVSKTLNLIYYYDQANFIRNLMNLVFKKNEVFDEIDLKMINDKRQKDGKKELTMQDIKKMKIQLENMLRSLNDE